MIYLAGIMLLAGAAIAIRALRRRAHRTRILASRLSDEDRALMLAEVPILTRLPAPLLARLEGKVQLFRDQVTFVGAGGLEVDEGMALSIAGQACLLVANTDAWFTTLRTVIVYPGAFKSKQAHHDGHIITEEDEIRIGESWAHGPVILSWQHTEAGARDTDDGHNVVFHEFAHQLDALTGDTDAVPILRNGQSFDTWAEVFDDAYDRHLANLDAGRRTSLDPYGATNQQEFFAVAVQVVGCFDKRLDRDG
ncbi:MAG: M90 family metallopeptidase, partial [Planctomycetota bacterium]